MNKRIISLILSLVMAFAMIGTMAVSAFAANSKDTYVTSSVRHTDARNEFTNTNSKKKDDKIIFTPKHIYYASDGLYAEYYITNGLDHDIRLQTVDLKISSSQGAIAWGHFDLRGMNKVLHSGNRRVETFHFKSKANYNPGMNLHTTIHTEPHVTHEDI